MKTRVAYLSILLISVSVATVAAQGVGPPPKAMPAPAPPPAAPQMDAEMDPVAMMRQMGMGEEQIMMLQLLAQAAGMDLGQAMMLFMLADQGKINDDIVGMLLFSKAFSGGGGKQPAALLAGDALLVVEDGTVYKIDIGKMEVTGSVSYRPPAQKTGLPGELMPMMMGAREKAQLAACTSNMKQVCLAALMYSQDHQNTLPTENWVEGLYPYCKNRAIYVCPGQPDKKVAYALNEAIAGAAMAEVKDPSQVVLFFEADLPEDVPFGSADAVLGQPAHGGRIVVGFLDGHVQAMDPGEVVKLLERDPFE